jgi:hypothetical protein
VQIQAGDFPVHGERQDRTQREQEYAYTNTHARGLPNPGGSHARTVPTWPPLARFMPRWSARSASSDDAAYGLAPTTPKSDRRRPCRRLAFTLDTSAHGISHRSSVAAAQCHRGTAAWNRSRRHRAHRSSKVFVWLVIGVLAAGQRGYLRRSSSNCAKAGNTIATVAAGR